MSGNLLNNDNKTNYLFKKENFKSQTKLDGFSSGVTTRTFAQELYEGKSITLNSSIFGVDISKYPRINKIYENCLKNTSFVKALPKNQPDAE